MARAAALALLLLTAGCSWFAENRSEDTYTYNNYGIVPSADPDRKISERDCTRPAAPDGGNLSCS